MKDIFKMIIALVTFKWLFGGDSAEGGCSGCGCSTFGTVILIVIIYLIITYL